MKNKVKLRFGKCCAALAAILLSGTAAHQGASAADDVQRIIAVVNDAIVSDYDINERIGLIMATTGTVNSEEQFAQLRGNVLEMLVDEKLQIQEAFEKELTIEQAEVEQRYAQLAASNNVSVEQFDRTLEQMGASKSTILTQMRAAIAWEAVVDSQLRPFLAVSESEVTAYQENMQRNKGEPEYRLAEIYLAVRSVDREEETRQTADRLVEQIRGGANFAEVARQFSDSPTGAVGGDMGWMLADRILPTIRDDVVGAPEGNLIGPIRSSGGYSLYTLIDKRRVMMADLDETKLKLQQIVVPVNDRDPEELARAVHADTGRISRCRDVPSFATMVGARDYGSLGELKLGELPSAMKRAVENVEVGYATPPLMMGGDLRVLIVCGREDPAIFEPSFADIEDFLSNRRLDLMQRRYLRDLRRDAIIDYR